MWSTGEGWQAAGATIDSSAVLGRIAAEYKCVLAHVPLYAL